MRNGHCPRVLASLLVCLFTHAPPGRAHKSPRKVPDPRRSRAPSRIASLSQSCCPPLPRADVMSVAHTPVRGVGLRGEPAVLPGCCCSGSS